MVGDLEPVWKKLKMLLREHMKIWGKVLLLGRSIQQQSGAGWVLLIIHIIIRKQNQNSCVLCSVGEGKEWAGPAVPEMSFGTMHHLTWTIATYVPSPLRLICSRHWLLCESVTSTNIFLPNIFRQIYRPQLTHVIDKETTLKLYIYNYYYTHFSSPK